MTVGTKPKRDNKGKWLPGQSANPAGKPKGGVTDLRRQLSEHGEALTNKLINMALAGDVVALKICFDKLVPSLKPVSHKSERITLPPGANLSEKAMMVIEAAGIASSNCKHKIPEYAIARKKASISANLLAAHKDNF